MIVWFVLNKSYQKEIMLIRHNNALIKNVLIVHLNIIKIRPETMAIIMRLWE